MSKKLAIKGHPIRGNEVIELLEMMGGINRFLYDGSEGFVYFIEGKLIKFWYEEALKNTDFYIIYELEEFLEKYPYKVGDKVHIYVQNDDIDGRCDLGVAEITSMRWNPTTRKIAYKMKNINREFYKEEIKCKVDDSNKPIKVMEQKDKAKAPNLKGEDYSGKRFGYKIPDGYEFDVVVEGTIFLKPIKPKYPKTYEECREILDEQADVTYGYNRDILHNLQVLLVCRDAYRKIAGEEMGLGKPWEPNWNNTEIGKHCIFWDLGDINCDELHRRRCLLSFPTEEIRDTFYENFKDWIESCKELL